MRAKSVSVKGLFGVFDHEIPLHSAERVTIIHGPNGFGKTVMLKMITALAQGTKSIFERTPFLEFCLTFEDGTARVIRRRVMKESTEPKKQVLIELYTRDSKGRESPAKPGPAPSDVPRSILEFVDRHVPGLRLRRHEWVDASGREFSLADILQMYPSAGERLPQKYRPRLFADMSDDDLQVFFVETNRLRAEPPSPGTMPEDDFFDLEGGHLTRARQRAPLRVEQYAEDVVQRVKSVLADYAKNSQESDRTFPERLMRFTREGQKALEPRAILDRMTEIENKRRRLVSLGFLDREIGLSNLTEDDVRRAPDVLTIYVRDVQEKLQVFDDLARRIGMLMDIVNERFNFKRVSIDREGGFQVLSNSGTAIQLSDLSSGEQHELVVLYELLFRVPENGLVLVDEPEISLHVAWQSRFLADLIAILERTNAYALVATHSPVIIGPRWDLALELKAPDLGH